MGRNLLSERDECAIQGRVRVVVSSEIRLFFDCALLSDRRGCSLRFSLLPRLSPDHLLPDLLPNCSNLASDFTTDLSDLVSDLPGYAEEASLTSKCILVVRIVLEPECGTSILQWLLRKIDTLTHVNSPPFAMASGILLLPSSRSWVQTRISSRAHSMVSTFSPKRPKKPNL